MGKNNNCSEERNIVLEKYEMGRVLGQGTFAKVYHGKNLATNESVAIKVINKKEVMRDCLIMDQIKREISIMRLVRHPNVVDLIEVMATKSKIFFVMEFVRGGELFAKVLKGKLREDSARKYFRQLISAVDFCHGRGVFHRDLKPENLLLDHAGDLKVSDFGLSALPEQLRNDGMLHTQCGTPAYVAPEVLRKKGYFGAKADIWSCGVVLFVLLAGFLPFQDENVLKMYRKVFKAEFHFPKWFSEEAKSLISRLLVVDPEKRASIAEIVKHPWFSAGFEDDKYEKDDDTSTVSQHVTLSANSPAFFNAFELISSMSSGFNLSSLFEAGERKLGTMFTSRSPADEIMSRLEGAARKLGLGFEREKEFRVRMHGRRRKVGLAAEVFEVAPSFAVVEFSRFSGDADEFIDFCQRDLRPAINDIVWSWQGDTH